MKNKNVYLLTLVISLFLITGSVNAQNAPAGYQPPVSSSIAPPPSVQGGTVPNQMNYQAVARNVSGNILANQSVGIRITIEFGSGGSVLYSERHVPTTNQFGLFTLKIGSGTVLSGVYNSISWSNGSMWMKVDMDPAGGTSYTTMGESELLSSPYANYALASGDNHWYISGNDIFNANSGNVGIGTNIPLKKLHAEEHTLTGASNDFSSFSFYGNNINYNNVIIAEGNDDGTSGSTTAYSRGMLAGGQDVPTGGFQNYGVWGHVYGTGAGGWGGVFTHGPVTSTSTEYVQLAGPYAGVFMGGNVGIGTATPAYQLSVGGGQTFISSNTGLGSVYTESSLIIESTSGQWPRIGMVQVPHTSGNGLTMFGIEDVGGGLQVVTADQTAWAPVQASAFTVMSDKRMKNSIQPVQKSDYYSYLTQIRAIESAKYFYNFEPQRTVPHIGFISQTLPVEVQAKMSEIGGANSEERIGVSLADLSGLLLVGVKALDEKQTNYESEIATLKAQVQELKAMVNQLKK